MQSDILTAAVVVLAVGSISGAGPVGAMVQKAPLATTKMTVLVQDQQQLKQQQLQQQQSQRQELQEREMAAKAMRRAMIKREEAKIIGSVKKYLHTEYESYPGNR
jgi:predicted Holliday junction resolvase-like endonuclease